MKTLLCTMLACFACAVAVPIRAETAAGNAKGVIKGIRGLFEGKNKGASAAIGAQLKTKTEGGADYIIIIPAMNGFDASNPHWQDFAEAYVTEYIGEWNRRVRSKLVNASEKMKAIYQGSALVSVEYKKKTLAESDSNARQKGRLAAREVMPSDFNKTLETKE
jgi:hypothetical protein